MLSDADLRRYLVDRHAFRREQLILPDGRRFAAAEERWQTEHVFAPLDARDDDGWRYRLLYLELPRGHAKTTMGAMEALTVALLEDGVRVYFAGADKDQAGIGFEMLTGFIKRNPSLQSSFRILRDRVEVPATGTVVQVLSADAPTSYGLGGLGRGYLAIIDELWAHSNPDLWHSLWSATGKVPNWRVLVLSNSGHDFSSAAWKVRSLCAEGADRRFYLYSPAGVVASWLDESWVEMQRRSLPPPVYQRLIENKWVDGAGSLITREDLARCVDTTWRPQLAGADGVRYFVGVDLGLTHDRTARAVVHYDGEAQQVVLDDLRVWQGSKDDPVFIADIEGDLLSCDARFGRPEFYLDPWQLQSSIQRLGTRLRLREFTFTSESVRRLSETLYSLLHNGQVRLYPDAELEAELLRLQVRQTSYGWRIDHKAGAFSDRAMALGMAVMAVLTRGLLPEWQGSLEAPASSLAALHAAAAAGEEPSFADGVAKAEAEDEQAELGDSVASEVF